MHDKKRRLSNAQEQYDTGSKELPKRAKNYLENTFTETSK
jgi:hypothetical protein